MAEDSDDDEEAADLQRYQERHKLLTMRIDELKEESKRLDEGGAPERAVAAMDKQDRARDLATGLSSSDDSGDDRTPRLGGARVVKDGAAASGAAESDGGVALPAKALEGGLSARADALRQALERGIGASLLDKLTREVQKHHAMKGDGVAHDAARRQARCLPEGGKRLRCRAHRRHRGWGQQKLKQNMLFSFHTKTF